MGNNLCKERIDRADNSKSSFDRIIGRCAQICPSGGKKKSSNSWHKHVLETRPPPPPTSTQPKISPNNSTIIATIDPLTHGWRNVTLKPASAATLPPPITSSHPVPPPRKKRNSFMIGKDGRPGGFRDVFGHRRSSCDSALSFDRLTTSEPKRRNSSTDVRSEDFTDFSKDIPTGADFKNGRPVLKRKISKVGNKKSDKFFGENLSDCLSDEPLNSSTPKMVKKDVEVPIQHHFDNNNDQNDKLPPQLDDKDHLDTFIEKNIKHPNEMDKNINNTNEEHNIVLNDNDHGRIEQNHRMENELKQTSDAAPDTEKDNSKIEPPILKPKQNEQLETSNSSSSTLDKNSSLDRKAEFLMAMLEGYQNDEARYHNRSPIEEPLIIPKRKHGRHICDDDEKMKLVFQLEEKKEEEKAHEPIDEIKKTDDNVPMITEQPKSEKLSINNDDKSIDIKMIEEIAAETVKQIEAAIIAHPKIVNIDRITEPPPSPPARRQKSEERTVEKSVNKSVEGSEKDKSSSKNDKLEALPNPYENMIPVEEPLIVPTRSMRRRHICDDDDNLHHHIHQNASNTVHNKETDHNHHHHHHHRHHQHQSKIDTITAKLPDQPSPKKPDRDFSRYKKSLDLSVTPPADHYSNEINNQSINRAESLIERPTRRKDRSISRENLPSPPPRPTSTPNSARTSNSSTSSVASSPVTATTTTTVAPQLEMKLIENKHKHHLNLEAIGGTKEMPESLTQSNTIKQSASQNDADKYLMESLNVEPEKLESMLRKCNSNHSFLTPDLMDQIVNKVHGFKMSWDDHENVHHGGYDDGSTQVTPSSKLKTRKISVIRNKEMTEKPIQEETAEEVVGTKKPMFSIGDKEVEVSKTNNEKGDSIIDNYESKLVEIQKSIEKLGTLNTNIESLKHDESIKNEDLNTNIHVESKNNQLDTSHETIPSKLLESEVNSLNAKKSEINENKSINEEKISTKLVDKQQNENLQVNQSKIDDKFNDHENSYTDSSDEKPTMIKRTNTVIEMQNMATNAPVDSVKVVTETVNSPVAKDSSKKELVTSQISDLSNPAPSEDDLTDVLEGIYSYNKSILDDFQQFLENSQLNEKMYTATETESKNINITPTEINKTKEINKANEINKTKQPQITIRSNEHSEDEERPMTPPISFKLRNQHLFNTEDISDNDLPIIPDRRGSIVDHDQWFLNHHEDAVETPHRRESDIPYDTRKLFPFGKRERTMSECSDSFFEDLEKAAASIQSKSHENINRSPISSANGKKNKKSFENKNDELEHSTLLKFFDKK